MSRPSLPQLFTPPEGWIGDFGWLCGYSASAAFLNDAAERFSGATEAQRARDGHIVLAMVLDPGQPAISLVDAPGVAHLPMLAPAERPFRLLHAKVAMLGFRPAESREGWRVRLVVSTGNWTVETVEASLDLVWWIDIDSTDVSALNEEDADDESIVQRCADLTAASRMFDRLRPLFDLRLLQPMRDGMPSPTTIAMDRLRHAIDVCSAASRGAVPRFIDNWAQSLLTQLSPAVSRHASDVSRNFLVMGSGFYEAPAAPDALPSVLEAIVAKLRQQSLLTQKADIRVIVNQEACQGVAACFQKILAERWSVWPPGTPQTLIDQGPRRTLHAKFLYGANHRPGTGRCTSPWIYLGSGNLTGPGFKSRASAAAGNLEAGVVFAPEDMLLAPDEDGDLTALTEVLPVQWERPLGVDKTLQVGAEMPDRPDAFIAPPVAWFQWHEEDTARWLTASAPTGQPFEVLDADGTPVLEADGRWMWSGECPRQVTVRWAEGRSTTAVPVRDVFGRLAALPLTALTLDEAAHQLAQFPRPPDDDGEIDEPQVARGPVSIGPRAAASAVNSYAIRSMVKHLEVIAERQARLHELDWTMWCLRLEQVLTQAADSAEVVAFRRWNLNPLSVLRAVPFMPGFARMEGAPQSRQYFELLDRIELAWRVEDKEVIWSRDA